MPGRRRTVSIDQSSFAMYKFFATFVLLMGLADIAVLSPAAADHEPVAILSQESDSSPEGAYNWSFEAADGTKADQVAEPKTIAEGTVAENVHGSYSYVDPEGKTHNLQYVANEYGYFPKGDDVFPEIASHLAYLEAHPQPIEVGVTKVL